jgi:hypothetical protein
MDTLSEQGKNYAVAVLFGAIGGGLFVALITRAIPKMMTQMTSGMMQNMMNRMRESGFDPSEM